MYYNIQWYNCWRKDCDEMKMVMQWLQLNCAKAAFEENSGL